MVYISEAINSRFVGGKNSMVSIGVFYGFGDKEELTVAGASYTSNTVDSLTKLLLSMIE